MNKLRRLNGMIQVQWCYIKNLFWALVAVIGALELYLFYQTLNKAVFIKPVNDRLGNPTTQENMPWSLRFEEYLARSNWKPLFLLGLGILVLLLIGVTIRQRSVSKVEYTYGRLPVSEFSWFASIVLHGFIVFIAYLGVQLICVFAAYGMYLHFVPEEAVMTQSLFLAFLRWEFLLFIFPITDPLRMVFNVIVLLNLSFVVAYISMCILYKSSRVGAVVGSVFLYLFLFESQIIGWTIFLMVCYVFAISWMVYRYRHMKYSM